MHVHKINLNRERGYPFYMVFAFPPTGPVIYTGDLRSIREFTRMAPTHHGFAVPYRCGIRMATSGDDVVLLGRNSYHFNRNAELYVELEFFDRRRCMSLEPTDEDVFSATFATYGEAYPLTRLACEE